VETIVSYRVRLVRSRGPTPVDAYLPLRFFEVAPFRAAGRFAADAGLRAPGAAAGVRFAEDELDGAVARRAALRGVVVERRLDWRSVAIAFSSSIFLFGCFVFFAAVARAIDVLLLAFDRAHSISRSIVRVTSS
jgi:hypothetical protein